MPLHQKVIDAIWEPTCVLSNVSLTIYGVADHLDNTT